MTSRSVIRQGSTTGYLEQLSPGRGILVERYTSGQPRAWLRLEGLLTLALAASLYAATDASWMWFAILFFVPDISFAGYVAGARAGAIGYNALHSYVGPLAATLVLLLLNEPVTIPLIWFAHIGFDRVLGYGLKYPSAFQDTHLGRIGRQRVPERST